MPVKCEDSALLTQPLHPSASGHCQWPQLPFCVSTHTSVLCCPGGCQTEIHTAHTNRCSHPSGGAGQMGLWCWNGDNTDLVQAMSTASATPREDFVCTPLKSCSLSLCLGESKTKRHFPPSPGTGRALGCCQKSPRTLRKVWIVEVDLSTWDYWLMKHHGHQQWM